MTAVVCVVLLLVKVCLAVADSQTRSLTKTPSLDADFNLSDDTGGSTHQHHRNIYIGVMCAALGIYVLTGVLFAGKSIRDQQNAFKPVSSSAEKDTTAEGS